MVERNDKRGGSGWAIALVALLILLPVLYVASIGPACWLFYWDVVSIGSFNAFYAPILWLGERSELIGDAIRWYVSLWIWKDEL